MHFVLSFPLEHQLAVCCNPSEKYVSMHFVLSFPLELR